MKLLSFFVFNNTFLFPPLDVGSSLFCLLLSDVDINETCHLVKGRIDEDELSERLVSSNLCGR